ncbi:hypothetical protein HDU96_006585 [Phlyctochytrium bullatum]|nr:hypothetical protein HDU96_006585 [Phlyctochytrium bullatum]
MPGKEKALWSKITLACGHQFHEICLIMYLNGVPLEVLKSTSPESTSTFTPTVVAVRCPGETSPGLACKESLSTTIFKHGLRYTSTFNFKTPSAAELASLFANHVKVFESAQEGTAEGATAGHTSKDPPLLEDHEFIIHPATARLADSTQALRRYTVYRPPVGFPRAPPSLVDPSDGYEEYDRDNYFNSEAWPPVEPEDAPLVRACANRVLEIVFTDPTLREKFLVFGSRLTEHYVETGDGDLPPRPFNDLDLMYVEKGDGTEVEPEKALTWEQSTKPDLFTVDAGFPTRFEDTLHQLTRALMNAHTRPVNSTTASKIEDLYKRTTPRVKEVAEETFGHLLDPAEIEIKQVTVVRTFEDQPSPSAKLAVAANCSSWRRTEEVWFSIDVTSLEPFVGPPQKAQLRTSFLREHRRMSLVPKPEAFREEVESFREEGADETSPIPLTEAEKSDVEELETILASSTVEASVIPLPTLISWKIHSVYEEPPRWRPKDLYDLAVLLPRVESAADDEEFDKKVARTASYLLPHVRLACRSRGDDEVEILDRLIEAEGWEDEVYERFVEALEARLDDASLDESVSDLAAVKQPVDTYLREIKNLAEQEP